MECTFTLIGPGIISGPWRDADYTLALTFVEDMQEAMGLPAHKLGNWLIEWHEIGESYAS